MERLRPDELAAFKAAFDTFDRNADGTITTKELHAAMRSGGQNPTESEVTSAVTTQLHTAVLQVQDMINTVDVDGSGFLEFPEFCTLMHKKISDTGN